MIYDLIVRRFLACFGKPGEREFTAVKFDISGEGFVLRGVRTTKIEWQRLYFPYSKTKEVELPILKVGEQYTEETKIEEKETQPPKRYTPASIIKELEKNKLGTKATRAEIVDKLYRRNYIVGKFIEVTKLGITVVDTFAKYAPDILSVELTSKFESALDKIQAKSLGVDAVLDKVKKVLIRICAEFKEHKEEIGESLGGAVRVTEKEQRVLCKCLKCKKGDMQIIKSRKSGKRFLACSGYPACKTTWPLPQIGALRIQSKKCESCGLPLIAFYTKGKRPWIICVNPDCESKKTED
jgi:DNA topoisomerase-1